MFFIMTIGPSNSALYRQNKGKNHTATNTEKKHNNKHTIELIKRKEKANKAKAIQRQPDPGPRGDLRKAAQKSESNASLSNTQGQI